MKLTVNISKTRDGTQDYLQITSDDMFSINVVLLADQVILRDDRTDPTTKEEQWKSSQPRPASPPTK